MLKVFLRVATERGINEPYPRYGVQVSALFVPRKAWCTTGSYFYAVSGPPFALSVQWARSPPTVRVSG